MAINPRATKLLTILTAVVIFLALQLMGALFGGAFDHLLVGENVSPRLGLAIFAVLWALFGLSFADSSFRTLRSVFSSRAKAWRRRRREAQARRAQEEGHRAAQGGFEHNADRYYAARHATHGYRPPMRNTHAPLTRDMLTQPALVEHEVHY